MRKNNGLIMGRSRLDVVKHVLICWWYGHFLWKYSNGMFVCKVCGWNWAWYEPNSPKVVTRLLILREWLLTNYMFGYKILYDYGSFKDWFWHVFRMDGKNVDGVRLAGVEIHKRYLQ